MSENNISGAMPGLVPDPVDNSVDDTEETAEISSDVQAAPYPYEADPNAVQDDGSDPDADLG